MKWRLFGYLSECSIISFWSLASLLNFTKKITIPSYLFWISKTICLNWWKRLFYFFFKLFRRNYNWKIGHFFQFSSWRRRLKFFRVQFIVHFLLTVIHFDKISISFDICGTFIPISCWRRGTYFIEIGVEGTWSSIALNILFFTFFIYSNLLRSGFIINSFLKS